MATTGVEPAKRGRPRRGPDPARFAEIVEAAADIILEKGYSATSIQDIADSVGILKGSLYHYVRSKEDFLFKIIKDVFDQANAEILELTEQDVAPLERLALFVRAHVTFAAQHLTAYTIQLREFNKLSEERQEAIRQGGATYIGALRVILEDGQAAGAIDPNLDTRLSSIIITGELSSMTRWYRPGGTHTPDQLADIFIGLILSSVASEEAIREAGGAERLRQKFTFAGH